MTDDQQPVDDASQTYDADSIKVLKGLVNRVIHHLEDHVVKA